MLSTFPLLAQPDPPSIYSKRTAVYFVCACNSILHGRSSRVKYEVGRYGRGKDAWGRDAGLPPSEGGLVRDPPTGMIQTEDAALPIHIGDNGAILDRSTDVGLAVSPKIPSSKIQEPQTHRDLPDIAHRRLPRARRVAKTARAPRRYSLGFCRF